MTSCLWEIWKHDMERIYSGFLWAKVHSSDSLQSKTRKLLVSFFKKSKSHNRCNCLITASLSFNATLLNAKNIFKVKLYISDKYFGERGDINRANHFMWWQQRKWKVTIYHQSLKLYSSFPQAEVWWRSQVYVCWFFSMFIFPVSSIKIKVRKMFEVFHDESKLHRVLVTY